MNITTFVSTPLKRVSAAKGGEYHGPCPLPACGGAGDNRFHVWPDQGSQGTFWCRQCKAGGDAIAFVRLLHGCSYREACELLGAEPKAMGERIAPAVVRSFVPAKPAQTVPRWREKAGAFVEYCHAALLENDGQLIWLEARGIGRELVKRYRLGWNGKDLWRERPAWGLHHEAKENGRAKKLWLPEGLVIPLHDDDGAVLRLRIRRPNAEKGPRYYVVPGSSREPLVSRKADAYVVVESELDAILLDGAAGDLAGMVALGNDSAKPTERLYGWLCDALHISVSLDSDEPRENKVNGRMEIPGANSSRWWLQQFAHAERVPMVGGKDPGEMFAAGVPIRTWVLAGLPPRFHFPRERGQAERELLPEEQTPSEAIAVEQPNQPAPGAIASPGDDQQQAGEAAVPLHIEVDLADGRTVHVTDSVAMRAELISAGKIVFAGDELARLHDTFAGCGADRRAQALQTMADIKDVFGEAYVVRCRPVQEQSL